MTVLQLQLFYLSDTMTAAEDDTGPLYFQLIAEELHTRSQSTNSTNLISALLVLVLSYQIFYWLDYPVLPMSELLWNTAVHATPSRIISALESALLPITTGDPGNDAEPSRSITHAQKSETMRRVLGLDGTGILGKFQRARSVPAVNTLLQARPQNSPPGLGNWDNSCYQNSVIQGLASLPLFSAFLRQSDSDHSSRSTRAALRDIIEKLKDQSNLGTMFWTPAQLKSMSSWQQQDAQEYFSKLMDEVEKEAALDGKREATHGGLAAIRYPLPDSPESLAPEVETTEDKAFAASKAKASLSQLPDELQSTVARNPLEGLLAQRVGCLKCGFVEGLSLIPFNCLTLPLGKQLMYDIRSCLDEYTALEPIDGVECAKCTLLQSKTQLEKLRNQLLEEPARELRASAPLVSQALKDSVEERLRAVNEALDDKDFSDNTILKKCQVPQKSRVSSTKTRQAVIARAPKSLAIHVNRSVFDEMTGMLSKNHADVRFPLCFSLASWCLGGESRAGDGREGSEHWNTNPSESMLPADIDDEERADPNTYELRAALTHYGRHENGHYICYRRHEMNTKADSETSESKEAAWWRFSDEEVSAVSEDSVLAQGGVFMLFYEKVDDPTSSPTSKIPPTEHVNLDIATKSMKAKTEDDNPAADLECNDDEPVPLAAEVIPVDDEDKSSSNIPTPPEAPVSKADTQDMPTPPIPDPTINPISNPELLPPPETSETSSTTLHPPLLPPQPPSSTSPGDEPSSATASDPAPSPSSEVPHKPEKRPSFSHSMRTATPRSGRGNNGMGQVSSMVTAN